MERKGKKRRWKNRTGKLGTDFNSYPGPATLGFMQMTNPTWGLGSWREEKLKPRKVRLWAQVGQKRTLPVVTMESEAPTQELVPKKVRNGPHPLLFFQVSSTGLEWTCMDELANIHYYSQKSWFWVGCTKSIIPWEAYFQPLFFEYEDVDIAPTPTLPFSLTSWDSWT